jgi:hypothetical protein
MALFNAHITDPSILTVGTFETLKINIKDSGTGFIVGLNPDNLTSSYELFMPPNQGGFGETLINDGTGNLAWAVVGSGNPFDQTLNTTDNPIFTSFNSSAVNTLIGLNTGIAITTGIENLLVGSDSGITLDTGNNNTFIGHNTGTIATNVNGNTLVGTNSGSLITSSSNTLIGFESGINISNGGNNTILGYQSGTTLTTGQNNVILGPGTRTNAAADSNKLHIGNILSKSLITGDFTTNNIAIGLTNNNPDFGGGNTCLFIADNVTEPTGVIVNGGILYNRVNELNFLNSAGIARKLNWNQDLDSTSNVNFNNMTLNNNLLLTKLGGGTITVASSGNVFANYSLIMPDDNGDTGEVLTTDGSGNLSWSNVATGIPTSIEDGLGTTKIETDATLNTLTFTSNNVERGSFDSTGNFILKKSIILTDNTVNELTISVPTVVTPHILTLPGTAAILNGQVLSSTTGGILSWTTVNTGIPISIADSTGADTKIETEATLDNLTFTTGGVERLNINATGVVDFNSTSIVNINNLTQSTISTDGALIIDGGVGIGKNVNIAGATKITDATSSGSPTSGALIVTGGIGTNENIYANGLINAADTTTSTDNISGALIIGGGAGIGKNINIGTVVNSEISTIHKNIFNNIFDLNQILTITNVYRKSVINNDYLFISHSVAGGATPRLQIYDMNNFTNIVDNLVVGGTNFDIKGNNLYVAGTTDINIYQISNLPILTVKGTITVATISFESNIIIQSNVAYVSHDTNKISSIDISDPDNPTVLHTLTISTFTTNTINYIKIRGRYIYASLSLDDILLRIDINDPTLLIEGSNVLTSVLPNRFDIIGNYLYVLCETDKELDIYNIGSNSTITLVNSNSINATFTPNSIKVSGNYAYIDYQTPTTPIEIYDIQDPLNILLIHTITTALTGVIGEINIFGKYLFSGGDDLEIYNLPHNILANASIGDLHVNSLIIKKDTSINNNLIVNGDTTLIRGFTSYHDSSINSNLRIHGDLLHSNTNGTITHTIPGGITGNYELTWPIDDGSNGQVLTSDGLGILSWTTPVTGSTNSVFDVDNDTKIEVEATPDNDLILFTAGGNLAMTINGSGGSPIIDVPVGVVLNMNDTTPSSTSANGALTVDGGVGIGENLNVGGNAIITGNLTINGTTTTLNTSEITVNDPSIKLANGNITDLIDIAIYGEYDTGTTAKYSGLFRDANDSGKWKLFDSLEVEPTTTVNVAGTNYNEGTLVLGGMTLGGATYPDSIAIATASTNDVLTLNASGDIILQVPGGGVDPTLITDGGNTSITSAVTTDTLIFTTNGVERLSIEPTGTIDIKSTSAVTINNITDAIDKNSGALIIEGGVGIEKKLFVGTDLTIEGTGNFIMEGSSSGSLTQQVPATITIPYTITWPDAVGTLGEALITDASGNLSWAIAVAATPVLIESADTFTSVTTQDTANILKFRTNNIERMTIGTSGTVDFSTTSQVNINATTTSGNASQGALVINGGLGVAENVHIGGTLDTTGAVNINSVTSSDAITTGALIVDGGVGIAENLNVGGKFDVNGQVNINALNTSSNTTTGALIIDGGVGIAENLNVGGNTILTGNLIVNGTTTTLNTSEIMVNDPSIKLANGNATDLIDVSIYGEYDTGTTAKYSGLFRDANDSGKWKLFDSLEVEPTTTVNVVGTGYNEGTLVLGGMDLGGAAYPDSTAIGAASTGDVLTLNASGDIILQIPPSAAPPTAILDTIGGDTGINTQSSVNVLTFTTAGTERLAISAAGIVDFNSTTTININNTTTSSSVTSGALIVDGGVGIASSLSLGGRIKYAVRTSAIATSLDNDRILNMNNTSTVSVTLPDLTDSTYDGVEYIIIKQTSNTINVDTATSPDKIVTDGSEVDTIAMIGGSGERLILLSNGIRWFVM